MREILKLDGFVNATLEIQKIKDKKTIFLIFPGGSYHHLSKRESTPVANKLNELGYNAALLNYSVAPFTYKEMLQECDVAINYLSKNYNTIILLGFSAGGHLAGVIGTSGKYKNVKAMVLAYPVISFLENVESTTMANFLGTDLSYRQKELYSIEKRVDEETVPTYIWTCKEDEVVPYENTLAMIRALGNYNIPYDSKIFLKGKHCMALADITAIKNNDSSYASTEISRWLGYAIKFLKGQKLI